MEHRADEDRATSESDQLRQEYDRLTIGLLAQNVVHLTAIVGQLNALIGAETGTNTERHIALKEELFDVVASLTSVADHFAPPRPPEEV